MSNVNLVMQVIGGFVGGNALGLSAPRLNLGIVGNTFAGVVGAVACGSLLGMAVPAGSSVAVILHAVVPGLVGAGFVALLRQYTDKPNKGPTLGETRSSGGTTTPVALKDGVSLPIQTLTRD
jgi:uncharacterized membrane protein YeaQ/YmgE (transglycosylase-associated protein family)